MERNIPPDSFVLPSKLFVMALYKGSGVLTPAGSFVFACPVHDYGGGHKIKTKPIKQALQAREKINMVVIPINIVYNRIKKRGVRMDALRKAELYTIEDIYALPDGERAELVDGKIYYMAPPNTKHQTLVMDLSYQIKDYIKRNNGECSVFPAPFAVFLNENDRNYVEPDISVICDKNKITDQGCHGSPDWVIEIVSPSSRPMDYFTKLFKYRTSGVREYWIVDPVKQRVTVYFFEREFVEEYPFGTDIPAGIYEGFYIRVE